MTAAQQTHGFAPLANAVRANAQSLAERTGELQNDLPPDFARLARDVAELARVLARVLEGRPVLKAFGAPGDWGYGTQLGDALHAVSRCAADGSAS